MKLYRVTYSGLYEHKDSRAKRLPIEDCIQGWRDNKPEALEYRVKTAKTEIAKHNAAIMEIASFLVMVAPDIVELRARAKAATT